MDIWTVLKACVRRWYVFGPTLGLALWLAYSQMQSMPPAYTATSSATIAGPALVPGEAPGEIIEVNPFERLGGSLNATGQVMASLMDSGPKRVEFGDAGVTEAYEVSQDDAVIYFDVQGADADGVVTSATRLVELLDTELATLQGRAVEAPESRVRAVTLSVPTVADEDPIAGLRLFAVLAALGLVLAVALALVVDAVAQSRRRRTPTARYEAHRATSWVRTPAVRPLRRQPATVTRQREAGPADTTQPIVVPGGAPGGATPPAAPPPVASEHETRHASAAAPPEASEGRPDEAPEEAESYGHLSAAGVSRRPVADA